LQGGDSSTRREAESRNARTDQRKAQRIHASRIPLFRQQRRRLRRGASPAVPQSRPSSGTTRPQQVPSLQRPRRVHQRGPDRDLGGAGGSEVVHGFGQAVGGAMRFRH
jgi:hypothetical protein